MLIHEQFFECGDRAFNAAVGPENGPPLIMFHGVTRRWQTFVPLLPAMTLRHRVFAFDFPGHGKSDRTPERYRVVDYVEQLETILRMPPFSTQQKLILYGHSLGAMVATDLAVRLRNKVTSVILEDPPFHTMGERIADTPLLSYFQGMSQFANSPDSVQTITTKLADVTTEDPTSGASIRLGDVRDAASLRFTARCLSQLDPRVFEPIIASRWLEDYDWQNVLQSLESPTLLLQADPTAGGMLTDEDAGTAAGLASDLTVVRYPDTGHLIHWQRTNKLLRHVEAFLESIR